LQHYTIYRKSVGTVAVAVKVWIGEASHSVLPPLTGAAGTAFIVKVTAVQ
jgi:hypothetical protein